MRIPAKFNRYKNDGRTIDIDLNGPVIHQLSEKEGKAATIRFVEWLRSYGWRVQQSKAGGCKIGRWTSELEKSVASLELLLLDEFSNSGVVY